MFVTLKSEEQLFIKLISFYMVDILHIEENENNYKRG